MDHGAVGLHDFRWCCCGPLSVIHACDLSRVCRVLLLVYNSMSITAWVLPGVGLVVWTCHIFSLALCQPAEPAGWPLLIELLLTIELFPNSLPESVRRHHFVNYAKQPNELD